MQLTGREAERGLIRRVARAAAAGVGGSVVVVGEAGIGKSALLDAAAGEAGLRVLRGRAWEEGGAPPYWPWREIADAGGWDLPWEGADELVVFGSVLRALHVAAAAAPLLVTVDDLHAADEGTVRLTRFVARAVADLPVALVVASRPSPRVEVLYRDSEVVVLQPLDAEEAAALVDRFAADGLDAARRRQVAERAGGNPLFLRELARSAAGGVPPGVRAAVSARLAALPAGTAAAVRAAALLGREVDAGAVASVIGVAAAEVLELLGPAVEDGLLATVPPGRWRFVHDLVREAAEAELAAADRARLHAMAARAPGVREHATSVARHLLAGVPAVPAAEAVSATARAVDEACSARSLGAAVQLLADALPLMGEPAERLAWLLRLGELALEDAQVQVCHEAYDEALLLSRRVGDAQALARAALGRTERLLSEDAVVTHLPVLDEALAADPGPEWSVRLAARRALLLRGSDPAAARAAAEHAVLAAEGLADEVRFDALAALHVTCWGPDAMDRAAEVSAELLAIAGDDPGRRVEALMARLVDHLRAGDLDAAETDVSHLVTAADVSGRPRDRYFAVSRTATTAFLRGRIAEGERQSELARRLGEQIEEPDTVQVFHGSRVAVMRHLHDREDLVATAAWFDVEVMPHMPHAGWFGAAIHAALDDGTAAVAGVRQATAGVPDAFHPGRTPLMELCLSVDAAVVARDLGLAAELQRALRPFTGQLAVNSGAVSVAGLVDHHLGRLCALLGQQEEAEQLLRTAVARYRKMGATLLLGDAEAALAELAPPTGVASAEGGDPRTAVLRRVDGGWEVGFEGRTAVLADARGLQHLAVLLARPGQDVRASELVAPESAGLAAAEARDALLDDTAKAAYRGRIAALRSALDEADGDGDRDRSDRLQAELDALVSELRRAVGLGGRDRTASSADERARVAVRKAVTASMDRVAQHDAGFAHLLRSTVRTGRTCTAVPDPNHAVVWLLG